MFKRKNELASLPPLLTDKEILEDLETFTVNKTLQPKVRSFPKNDEPISDQESWNSFETFLQDVVDFKNINQKINNIKEILNNKKIELEEKDLKMREIIDQNLDKINKEINN